MQPITDQAQQTIQFQQARLSPYSPLLVRILAKTYLLPLGALLLAYIVANVLIALMPDVLGGMVGTLGSLVLFLGFIYFGWRLAENRWHGTELLLTYTAVSKARRTLEAELELGNPSAMNVQQSMSEYVKLADNFIETMHNHNLYPEIIETT